MVYRCLIRLRFQLKHSVTCAEHFPSTIRDKADSRAFRPGKYLRTLCSVVWSSFNQKRLFAGHSSTQGQLAFGIASCKLCSPWKYFKGTNTIYYQRLVYPFSMDNTSDLIAFLFTVTSDTTPVTVTVINTCTGCSQACFSGSAQRVHSWTSACPAGKRCYSLRRSFTCHQQRSLLLPLLVLLLLLLLLLPMWRTRLIWCEVPR